MTEPFISCHRFQNMIRSFHCIEGFEIPCLSPEQQSQFVRDPVNFFLKCEDQTAEFIFSIIKSRQHI